MNTGDKLLSILQLYTIKKSEWTVEEAALELGVSVSTAYRYFRSLCKIGLLDSFNSDAYVLGPGLIEYDRLMRVNDPMIKVGRAVMQRLITRSGGTGVALLCRVYRNCVMCVHQEGDSSPRNGVSYERGRPMPLFRGASSKVIFAHLPARSIRLFFERCPKDIAKAGLGPNWETLKANLRKIRKAGLVVARGEVDQNLVGIAAPIFYPDKKIIGSITVVMVRSQASPQMVANVSALVDAAGREIHAGLLHLHDDTSNI